MGTASPGITLKKASSSASSSRSSSCSLFRHFSWSGIALVPHFLMNAIILWEPFFLFAWLHSISTGLLVRSRYPPPASALVPTILARTSCRSSCPLRLSGSSLLPSSRLTENIFIMWPLTWSTASAEGSLEGGFLFGWNDVVVASLILTVQNGIHRLYMGKIREASEHPDLSFRCT